MSKSILVIDTKDLKDMIEVLRMNEMYCEANVLEQCPLQDASELLELKKIRKWWLSQTIEWRTTVVNEYNKALGGKDE